MSDRSHGTTRMYNGGGCRCDECREAWSAYYTNRRRNDPSVRERHREVNRASYHRVRARLADDDSSSSGALHPERPGASPPEAAGVSFLPPAAVPSLSDEAELDYAEKLA